MSPSFTEDDVSTTLAGSSAGSGAGSPRSATSGRSLFSRILAPQSETTSVQGSPTQADDDFPPTTDSGRVHLNSTLVGWPCLAQRMADTPEFECFRRFRELNVKTLLYYQVELAMLEDELREKEAVDMKSKGKQHSFSERADRMFRTYQNNKSGPGAGPETEQCKLVLEVRRLLGQYNAALLQHAEVSSLPHPNPLNVRALGWEIDGTYTSLVIRGVGSDAWNISKPDSLKKTHLARRILSLLKNLVFRHETSSKTVTELVTVHPPPELDILTRWVLVAQDLTPFWHNLWRKNSDPNGSKPTIYSGGKMLRRTSAMTTIIACLLPIAGIWTLTTAETTTQKIGYIAGFTTLFAIVVTWNTDANSRLHIFTATSAFSAVLVVFVQNQ